LKLLHALVLILVVIVAGCNTGDTNDKEKRNTHWDWWVDASSGRGTWIPLSDHPTWTNGIYTSFYYDGKVFERGTIREGKHVDTTFWFDREGNVYGYKLHLKDTSIDYFIKDGPIKVFGNDGKIRMEGIVKDHKSGDRWTEYYKSGFKQRDCFLVNDTGWCIKYYETEQLEDSMFFMGNTFAVVKHWFENGQLAHSVGWKNNQFDGELLDYYENGQLKQKGFYKKGQFDGQGEYWYPSGKLNGIVNYQNGVTTGRQITYFENGQTQVEAFTVDGKLEGEQKIYNEQGKLVKDAFYKNGMEVNKTP